MIQNPSYGTILTALQKSDYPFFIFDVYQQSHESLGIYYKDLILGYYILKYVFALVQYFLQNS